MVSAEPYVPSTLDQAPREDASSRPQQLSNGLDGPPDVASSQSRADSELIHDASTTLAPETIAEETEKALIMANLNSIGLSSLNFVPIDIAPGTAIPCGDGGDSSLPYDAWDWDLAFWKALQKVYTKSKGRWQRVHLLMTNIVTNRLWQQGGQGVILLADLEAVYQRLELESFRIRALSSALAKRKREVESTGSTTGSTRRRKLFESSSLERFIVADERAEKASRKG